MATLKVKFRASAVPGKEGMLYCRVARQVNAGSKLYAHERDVSAEALILPRAGRPDNLGSPENTLCDGAEGYLAPPHGGGLVHFACEVIRRLERSGKLRTAEKYTNVIRSFSRFLGGGDVSPDEVDSDLMLRYENFLESAGLCPNTSSYYLRGMRAIYNRAVEKGLTAQRSPFRHVYTGIDKTVKRAVPLQVIRRFRELDLSSSPAMDFARDMFLFSFYTRGMSFVDMAYLRKQDLRGGVLTYRRQKTGQLLAVRWEPQMQEIVDKYDNDETPYLLPIVLDMTRDARRQYLSAGHLVNRRLKEAGRMLGLDAPLTMYVARHSWASIAGSAGIPLPVISGGMGHDSEGTTRIYLASLDTSEIDKANRSILKML